MEVTDEDGGKATFGTGQNLDDLPDWLHLYPDSEVQVGFTQSSGDSATGALSQSTDDSVDEVADHFEQYFESQGWQVTRNQMTSDGQKVIIVSGTSEDGSYTQAATAATDDEGRTQIAIQYQGSAG